jgi:hypothetical protein
MRSPPGDANRRPIVPSLIFCFADCIGSRQHSSDGTAIAQARRCTNAAAEKFSRTFSP